MSTGQSTNGTTQLSPTSYLVLGLLAREGPSTPYDLKRYVAATMGHLWSFPHALLYAEPPRLVALGLGTETQEEHGRRRRTFTITSDGVDALRAWLRIPSLEPTELRDTGLLQLFFADLGSSADPRLIADEQLPLHRAKLAGYEEDERLDREAGAAVESPAASRTLEHWRGQTVHMGVLYERAAVDFWEGVAAEEAGAGGDEAGAARARAADDGAAVAWNDVGQSINNEHRRAAVRGAVDRRGRGEPIGPTRRRRAARPIGPTAAGTRPPAS
jgi:DNA-binding PadR family transcriptional regulator